MSQDVFGLSWPPEYNVFGFVDRLVVASEAREA